MATTTSILKDCSFQLSGVWGDKPFSEPQRWQHLNADYDSGVPLLDHRAPGLCYF